MPVQAEIPALLLFTFGIGVHGGLRFRYPLRGFTERVDLVVCILNFMVDTRKNVCIDPGNERFNFRVGFFFWFHCTL
jgi:hypothetical protein